MLELVGWTVFVSGHYSGEVCEYEGGFELYIFDEQIIKYKNLASVKRYLKKRYGEYVLTPIAWMYCVGDDIVGVMYGKYTESDPTPKRYKVARMSDRIEYALFGTFEEAERALKGLV